MGWVSESCEHEGYLAMTFADGVSTTGRTGRGALVTRGPDGRPVDEVRPYADVTGWRLVCDCTAGTGRTTRTWQGSTWLRVARPADEQLDQHRIYAPDDDTDVAERPEVERAVLAEWERHIDSHQVGVVHAAATEAAAAVARLNAAVSAARAAGASWAEVGDAAGMARQSAHERWA